VSAPLFLHQKLTDTSSLLYKNYPVATKKALSDAAKCLYSHLAPSHKVKAVDLLDSKLNEVCEKEVSVV